MYEEEEQLETTRDRHVNERCRRKEGRRKQLETTRDRHVNEICRRKEGRRKQGQTNNKAKQHRIPNQSLFKEK